MSNDAIDAVNSSSHLTLASADLSKLILQITRACNMILKKQVFLGLVVIYFLVFIATSRNPNASELVSIQVGEIPVLVEVAETPNQRQMGLTNRHSLEANEGMLFIFDEEQIVSFWMKNTPLALDIGFFDRNGVLLSYAVMQPLDEKTVHRSPKPALYALEVAQGWFESNKIPIGARLKMGKMLPAN